MIIGKRFYFDSSHHLPKHQGKCHNLHGHTYTLDVEIQGKIQDTGMVLDLHDFGQLISQVLETFDHQNLDNLILDPTCENLLIWLKTMIKNQLPLSTELYYLKLQEGKGGYAKWTSQE